MENFQELDQNFVDLYWKTRPQAYVDTVWGGGFFGRGQRLVGGRRVGGSGGPSPPDAGEIFKIFRKNNEKLQFFKISIKILRFLQHFLKFLEFFAKIWGKFRIMPS